MARTLYFLRIVAMGCATLWASPALADTADAPAASPIEAGRIALAWKDVPRWSDVMARARKERTDVSACADSDTPACRYAAWQGEVKALRDRSPFEQLASVHAGINRLPYVSDLKNWRMADRWATPAEMFERGGDCEDYALTKYFALRELGFAESALQLAIVWDNRDDEQHAVLFVRADDAIWLLDNKFQIPLPASGFSERYRVIYSINQQRASFSPAALGAKPGKGPRLADGGRKLVFTTRPRRKDDAPVVQLAVVQPPAPVFVPAPASPSVAPLTFRAFPSWLGDQQSVRVSWARRAEFRS